MLTLLRYQKTVEFYCIECRQDNVAKLRLILTN